jgi:hypothetical protein
MSTRSSLILGVCLIVCCLILGASFGPSSLAQQSKKAQAAQPQGDTAQGVQPTAGRYQFYPPAGSTSIWIVDTATGQVWQKGVRGWQTFAIPPYEK